MPWLPWLMTPPTSCCRVSRIPARTTRLKVKDAMAKGKFEAVSGTITFDAFHTPIKPVTIIQIKDGKVEFNSQVMP